MWLWVLVHLEGLALQQTLSSIAGQTWVTEQWLFEWSVYWKKCQSNHLHGHFGGCFCCCWIVFNFFRGVALSQRICNYCIGQIISFLQLWAKLVNYDFDKDLYTFYHHPLTGTWSLALLHIIIQSTEPSSSISINGLLMTSSHMEILPASDRQESSTAVRVWFIY